MIFPNSFKSAGELEKHFEGTGAQIRRSVSTSDVYEVTRIPDNEGDFPPQHATYVLINGEYVHMSEDIGQVVKEKVVEALEERERPTGNNEVIDDGSTRLFDDIDESSI